MSLVLLQSIHAMAPNGLTTPFGASGGTEPYTYSVLPDGAGGSIDPSTGLYTSPSTTGVDVIQVIDADMATAQGTIAVNYPLSLVADIVATCMNLSNDQVYLWDQKIDIPKDSRLYVTIGVLSAKPFGNRPKYVSSSGLLAVQSVNMQALLSIDIFSRGPSARDLKEQVLLALSSPYAQQQMELNSFFIAPLTTTFVNLSAIDGAALPYRFNLSAQLQYFSVLNTQIDYFNTFNIPDIITEP